MNEVIDKLNEVLVLIGGLDARFDGIEKKVDTIEDEIKCIRQDASKNSERIIRLEESHKNLSKDVDRVEAARSAEIAAVKISLDERVDKKLLALKLAIYTSLTAVAFSVIQFAFGVWRAFR